MRDAAQMSAMLCPVCHVGLAMTDRQGVEIDYCPQCRGVWLDRGELDKIIERSAGGIAPAPTMAPPSYRPDRGHYDHGVSFQKKRKKSFLEELFD
ncbi:TFIIB-type zinc ribbon-containing protein [Sphingobium sp. CCH11-B1]|uniref:TFIIB-type zinc ribbon-containing protein n=1 Tax=Sphingobium sp. CCH11-B1 TaxID=1768781 RepID=UPI00083008C5|nr:zf-TFIIB domain-containing protein [Sphingobium sp. CCH11-B1]MEA3390795.1 zf-TFIIB domain-containing protein [Pseudomonadota bacterium]